MRHSHVAAEALARANSVRFKQWFGVEASAGQAGEVVACMIHIDLRRLRQLLGSRPVSVRMVGETVRGIRRSIDTAHHAGVLIPQDVLVPAVDVLARAELVMAGKVLRHGP